jgi:hypothetical protein
MFEKDGDSHHFLIQAKRQGKTRLVARYLNEEGDLGLWVGEIVNDERIDGEWANQGEKGRWDLRRKIAGK